MNQVYPNPTQGEKTKKKNVETIVEPEQTGGEDVAESTPIDPAVNRV